MPLSANSLKTRSTAVARTDMLAVLSLRQAPIGQVHELNDALDQHSSCVKYWAPVLFEFLGLEGMPRDAELALVHAVNRDADDSLVVRDLTCEGSLRKPCYPGVQVSVCEDDGQVSSRARSGHGNARVMGVRAESARAESEVAHTEHMRAHGPCNTVLMSLRSVSDSVSARSFLSLVHSEHLAC